MFTCEQCQGLFIDICDNLCCSETYRHRVVRISLRNPGNITIIVAGTGCSGYTANRLSSPRGIFVTNNLSLYVADYWNDRIQLFQAGEMTASTVVVNGPNGAITISRPTGVVLDGDGYLFIVDSGHHRIVGSGPEGFRCVVGCSGLAGSASDRLNNPQTLSFDTDGNMFVTDQDNNRIQKFLLGNNSGRKCKVQCEV